MPSAFVVGPGRLGSALLRGLAGAGWTVAGHARSARSRAALRKVRARSLPLPRCREFDLVFLAVPDAEVERVAAQVAPLLRRGQVVAHGAGALTLAALDPVSRSGTGAHAGSLHPIQALAGGPLQPGVTAAVAGDAAARRLLSRAARDLGLAVVRVPERGRALYHASAIMTANLVMALADLAVETWGRSGAPRQRALEALVPLLRSAVENLAERGLPGALTGPAARGDAEVVARQVAALDGEAREIYRLLSRRLVKLATKDGLAPEKARRTLRVLDPGRSPSP